MAEQLEETDDVDGVRGHCDTCGAPCDVNGCTINAAHRIAVDPTRPERRSDVILEVRILTNGDVELWSDRTRSPESVAAAFRCLATAFENEQVYRVR